MSLRCLYLEDTSTNETIYACLIDDQLVPSDCILDVIGEHIVGKTSKDVKEVKFLQCRMTNVPQGLTKIFPNMTNLTIWSSPLQCVNKTDLTEYRSLKRIYFMCNKLEFLPGNLFEGFENLEVISMVKNKLKLIEPNIFDGLNQLKHEAEKQQTLLNDIKTFISDDTFKDFKIKIGDREFLVHKFILAARSSTFAEIFKNNPEVESFNLFDIPVNIFEIILKFLYTDEFSKIDGLDLLHLFAASGRLKINELKNFAANEITNILNVDNALKILKLSNKYFHDQLKQDSFDKIKKKFPEIKFKDKWIDDPETVELIIEKFKEKENAKRKLDQDFESIRKKR